tara:strand:- start:44 stop:430 length:387 start_codon:yes stop_codon:yes gene_type:complete
MYGGLIVNLLTDSAEKGAEMDDTSTIVTVVLAMITALSSSKAWEYYAKKAAAKKEQQLDEKNEKNLYRDDLRKEVERLRIELKDLYDKRDNEIRILHEEMSALREELGTMRARVEMLESENKRLREEI